MKKSNFKYKRIGIMALVLCMGVGFAYLTSSLTITGRGHVKKTTWNVYFDNVNILKGQDLATLEPTTTGRSTTTLNYSVNFNIPGDTFQFTVDVVNTGTIDAMINLIDNTVLTAEQQKIASYTITYADDTPLATKNFLGASKRDTFKVTISYRRDMNIEDLPEETEPINFSLGLQYSQAKEADSRANSNLAVKNLANSADYNGEFIGGVSFDDDAVKFDGTTGYIDTKLREYEFGDNTSFVTRFKVHSLPEEPENEYETGAALIFGGGDLSYGDYGTGVEVLPDGKLKVLVQGNWKSKSYTTEDAIDLDTWYTVVVTSSYVEENQEESIAEDKNMRVYIYKSVTDEQTQVTSTQVVAIPDAITTEGKVDQFWQPLTIGALADYGRVAMPADVTVSDFLIFNRKLTPEEIASDYTAHQKVTPTNRNDLLIYYDFR